MPEPEDPVTAYLRSQSAIGDYIATAAGERPSSDGSTRANIDQPMSSDSVTASPSPKIVLVSDSAPAPSQVFDPDKYLKQGVRMNPDKTIKEMMVLVVTRPDGTTYIPKTKIKNKDQGELSGFPIGTEIPMPVPKTVNPGQMVNDWRAGRMAAPYLDFAWTWRKYGPNDYKRNTPPYPIYDAYGNLEYGATGATKEFSRELLLNMGEYLKSGHNDPVNRIDIGSGYDAIHEGGRLGEVNYVMPPHTKQQND